LEPDPPPPGTEPPASAPPETQPIKELPPASRRSRVWLIGLAAVLVAVAGGLGAMAALGVVFFGGAGCPMKVSIAATVTTTALAKRQERIRLPERLCGLPRTDPASTSALSEFSEFFGVAGASYGGTDAKHPALDLTLLRIPAETNTDMVATFINLMPEQFFRPSDFHTFKHGGVEYRCANGRDPMSGGRRALCIFYVRRLTTLVLLNGLEPRVADAKRLSEIADEARVALDTI
jgi:hypothetical protein